MEKQPRLTMPHRTPTIMLIVAGTLAKMKHHAANGNRLAFLKAQDHFRRIQMRVGR